MKAKWIILGIAGSLVFATFQMCKSALEKSHITASSSCLKSVAAAIQAAPDSFFQICPIDQEWRALSQSEFLKLSSRLRLHDLDCRTSANGEIHDRWGRPVRLAVRRIDGSTQFKVFSIGADGKEGTEDDLIELSNNEAKSIRAPR